MSFTGSRYWKEENTVLRPKGATFFKKDCSNLNTLGILPSLILTVKIVKVQMSSTVYLAVNEQKWEAQMLNCVLLQKKTLRRVEEVAVLLKKRRK